MSSPPQQLSITPRIKCEDLQGPIWLRPGCLSDLRASCYPLAHCAPATLALLVLENEGVPITWPLRWLFHRALTWSCVFKYQWSRGHQTDLPFLNRSPVLSQSFSPFSFFWTALTTQHYKFLFFPLECKFHVRNFYSLLYPQHLKQYQVYNSGLYLLMKNQNCGT